MWRQRSHIIKHKLGSLYLKITIFISLLGMKFYSRAEVTFFILHTIKTDTITRPHSTKKYPRETDRKHVICKRDFKQLKCKWSPARNETSRTDTMA